MTFCLHRWMAVGHTIVVVSKAKAFDGKIHEVDRSANSYQCSKCGKMRFVAHGSEFLGPEVKE